MPKFIGPFTVLEKIGPVAYKLSLPEGYRIHPVFHVSLLKPYTSDGRYQPLQAPKLFDDDGNAYWEVEDIIGHRDRKLGGSRSKSVREYLVKWLGFGAEHNSWEPSTVLCEDELVEQCINDYLERVNLRNAKRQRRATGT